ncbi:MAG: ABC transporter ATP-binding protein [Spirochaetia bacterium]
MVHAENMTKRYGQHLAVDHLNFHIDRGEILGFLGPNGAGKTTAMNIITGYLSATEGTVTVDGMDVLEHPEEIKRKIGFLPEAPPLYMDMTVIAYLKFVGEIKKVSKNELNQDLDRIMDLVKITDVQNRLIKNLSKGYKQRVGLAQALVGNPELLILDEPTVGLDPVQIIEIRNLIKSLSENHTIILSSHILPEVSAVCERVLILNNGRIVASDSPEHLARRLAGTSRLSLRISGSHEKVESALKTIPGIKKMDIRKSVEEGNVDATVEAQKDTDIRKDVFNAMARADCPILLMRPMDMSLEDIFLHLTTQEQEVS